MTAPISKRSQARNERAIQELIRTVPGNDRCADCQARNPGMSCDALVSLNLADKSFAFRVGQLERKSIPLHPRDRFGSYRTSCLLTRLYSTGFIRGSGFDPIPCGADRMVCVKLGIFLCMRCAALHRKLGTHVSKVKSLSMDSWSNEQVEVRLFADPIG